VSGIVLSDELKAEIARATVKMTGKGRARTWQCQCGYLIKLPNLNP
jgi:hypothetical protein